MNLIQRYGKHLKRHEAKTTGYWIAASGVSLTVVMLGIVAIGGRINPGLTTIPPSMILAGLGLESFEILTRRK